ncbi:MAG: glycosyltransferase family 4 protein [Chloroflexi bacterium]|nr:glycosyltransferase family 4 protein [Chloroflexota bacterium]
MKILIATGTFHPEIGGPPTYLYALCRSLVERGHRVGVVTYGQRGGEYPYPVWRVRREQPTPLRLARFALEVVRRGARADVMYVNDYGLPPALANLFLRKPMAMKVVGDFAWEYAVRHALIPGCLSIDEFQARRFSRSVEQLRAMQSWYVSRSDVVVVPSAYLEGIVSHWGVRPERLRVIYNAPTPAPRRSRATARTELGLTDDTFLVAALARLTAWKGIDHLVAAVGRLVPEAPALRLAVAGDGPERAKLEALAAPLGDAVTLLGEVAREQAVALIQAADVVALPSSYEGLSHVLLEAMEAGRAIVTTAVGGNRELIRDGENGLLISYGDVAGLSLALRRLMSEPGLAERLAAAAAAEAAERSWERLVDRTVGVLESIVKRPSA